MNDLPRVRRRRVQRVPRIVTEGTCDGCSALTMLVHAADASRRCRSCVKDPDAADLIEREYQSISAYWAKEDAAEAKRVENAELYGSGA